MSTIPDQFPLSLRAWPAKDDSATALASLISRINVERNGFRNVTEESLLEEIKKSEDGIDIKDDEKSEDDGAAEEEPDRLKELMTAREEMLTQLEQAHQASLIALDFVSLLLSKDTPVQASLSISPALRETVALGTLGADKVTETKVTRAQKLDNARVTKGWKLQSLSENADSILSSATKLENEIEAETRYWQQVVEVSDKGWAVCRLPHEKHTLGVRFGFSESAPAFKNRGLAALRRNGDGSIYIDQGITESAPRRMRVRIQTNGATTGQFLPSATVPDDAPILSLILRARNAIFEDELWQELNREGRILANQGVRCLGEEITCPLSPAKKLILDMVPGEDDQIQHDGVSCHDDDDVATMIYLSLHLLLSYAHRQIYRRRAQPQPPISNRPVPNPQYNLLRAIIARVQYHAVTSKLTEAISAISARLQAEAKTDRPWSFESGAADTSVSPIAKPPAERLIEQITTNLEAKFILPITSTPEQILTIRFRTTLYPLDTRYQISVTGPIAEICKPPTNPLSVDEVIEYMQWAADNSKVVHGR